MTGDELREQFLRFFEERNHSRVRSSSLVPSSDDATLLFTNAGMVQFKNVFTGKEKKPFTRAATAQKCLRVSGKHNDLENVGHTARHHTFFEMLGNFSFGDYFKEDAIAFGWEFLTKTVGLPKKQLHATIYKDDDEAYEIWKRVLGTGANPVARLGEKDNFWSMGDTGPCGPCSEVHIDQGDAVGCGDPSCSPECECDRYLELWNLVFMQYDRDASGTMTPLPRPSIDTGLGLERLAAVVQGVYSNWESDIFGPLIHKVEELSARSSADGGRDTVAIRVIADHSRAAAFLIADGVLPSNEGRGYVLRRILRRAMRYGKYIGLNEPFLFKTAGVVVAHMSPVYPELATNATLVDKVIHNEEERFLDTLARGLVLFEDEAERVRRDARTILPGQVAFRLYDTYGFPLDLTADLAAEAGLAVDQAGFDSEMARQREMARRSWDGMHGKAVDTWRSILDTGTSCDFSGYSFLEDSGTIKAIIRDGESVTEVQSGDRVDLVTDRTPFYGESGGQVGDHGVIRRNGDSIEVQDTLRPMAGFTVHRGQVKSGTFRVGERVDLRVDGVSRRSIMANHSATHLLQWALRKVLGDHVKQSGSLVEPSRLRFDFTHFSAISEGELDRVEDLVNEKIQENLPVSATVMSMKEAVAHGAIALFGEKYGETVRMVSMGDISRELCGGTHVRRTGDIGIFKIMSEGGIAAGVRRIEGVTAHGALDYVRSLEQELRQIGERIRGSRGELVRKLEKLLDEKKTADREIEALKARLASGSAGDILDGVKEVGGVKVLSRLVDHLSTPKDLRDYADRVRDKLGSGVALLGAKADDKALLIALVTKDLTKRFHAGEIVKRAAERVGGSGGGRPDMAQAGGPDVSKLWEALAALDEFVRP